MHRFALIAATVAALSLSLTSAFAGEADIVSASARQTGSTWTLTATVRHADEGWSHYADAWQALDERGDVIATRILAHPHVDEQPFTRSLSGVKIPEEVEVLTFRARDSVHGFGGREVVVELDRSTSD